MDMDIDMGDKGRVKAKERENLSPTVGFRNE